MKKQKFIVRCDRAGVFYGEIEGKNGQEIKMRNVRCLWYWEGAATLLQLAAETEQAQKTMEEQAAADRAVISAKAKAEQDVIAANAELEVTKIQAEAALYAGEKEAEMNKRIAESLTPSLIKYYYIKQWKGELPKTVLGESSSFMINLEQ